MPLHRVLRGFLSSSTHRQTYFEGNNEGCPLFCVPVDKDMFAIHTGILVFKQIHLYVLQPTMDRSPVCSACFLGFGRIAAEDEIGIFIYTLVPPALHLGGQIGHFIKFAFFTSSGFPVL